MSTISYFFRTTQKNKPVNIRCRLRAGRDVSLYANSQFKVLPQNWNAKKEHFKEVEDLEKRLKFTDLKKHLDNAVMSATKDDLTKKYTEDQINWLDYQIQVFHNPKKYLNKYTMFEFIEEFIDKAPLRPQKNGKPVCYKMQREYTRTFHYLKGFAEDQGHEPDFDDIDLDFYENFLGYLQAQNLATNTIGKKIQTLKIFLNAATDRGVNTNLKFKRKFYTISEESENIYLAKDELRKLWELDLSNDPKHERVRDLFLVGCWTGCRFSDISKINEKNIIDNFLHIEQQKTGNKVVLPIHPVVRSILNKYDGGLPRIISNQKYNEYLKEVAEKAEIKEPIEKHITKGGVRKTIRLPKHEFVTSHTARRSFATNLYKDKFPTRSIMKITGHKTEAAFLKYIKATNEEHAELLRDFWLDNGEHLKIAK